MSQTRNALQSAILADGVDGVVRALADICAERADHAAQWGYDSTAAEWSRATSELLRAARRIPRRLGKRDGDGQA